MTMLLITFLMFLNAFNQIFGATITINTALGEIKGTEWKSVGKQTVYSFYGIQYGVAPVGDLRFRPSQLNETKWNGIYDGTVFGDVCWQSLPPNNQPMSENCLFLNI
eukprot:171168_1